MNPAGEVFDIPAESYHADPAPEPSLSHSIAHVLCAQTPLHAWVRHPRLNPNYAEEQDKKFDIGTAAHALLLEGPGAESSICIVDAADWRTKKAQEARDAARAEGKTPLLAEQAASVLAMVKAAWDQLAAHKEAPDAFRHGKPEQSIVWSKFGIWLRARLDWLADDYTRIDDYKTTVCADPNAWTRTMFALGHDTQQAFYQMAVKDALGVEARFRFIVQETRPPYALSVVSLGPAALDIAKKKVWYAMEQWRDCLESGKWPCYPKRICYADLPPWEEARWLEKEEASV